MRLRPDPKDLNVMTPAPERPDPVEAAWEALDRMFADFDTDAWWFYSRVSEIVDDHRPKIEAAYRSTAPVTDAGLREAAQQMWFAHTEDESFRPDGPLSADPYGEFEVALRAALSRQAETA